MSKTKIYFIISCARSGSTSLTRILDTATNGRCLMEPMPNLNVESRDMMEGRVTNPRQILVDKLLPRIAKVLDEGDIYGEKNVTLGPFIPHLYEILRCKFVFLIRDGRDVVTSLMNWHNEVFGNFYRECKDLGPLSKIAWATLEALPIEQDTSDYARPRPGPSDPFYQEWSEFSRFEMVTWYWAYINQLFNNNLIAIPKEDWININYTGVQARDIERVFDFLGLTGFDQPRVEKMLKARINSVQVRTKLKPRFPSWSSWDADHKYRFDRIAAETIRLLKYYD